MQQAYRPCKPPGEPYTFPMLREDGFMRTFSFLLRCHSFLASLFMRRLLMPGATRGIA